MSSGAGSSGPRRARLALGGSAGAEGAGSARPREKVWRRASGAWLGRVSGRLERAGRRWGASVAGGQVLAALAAAAGARARQAEARAGRPRREQGRAGAWATSSCPGGARAVEQRRKARGWRRAQASRAALAAWLGRSLGDAAKTDAERAQEASERAAAGVSAAEQERPERTV
jgi:hypothetical protein